MLQTTCLFIIFSFVSSLSIRGFATVWRNSDNEIIKKVLYPSCMRFRQFNKYEHSIMQKLPEGIYKAKLVHTGCISYKKINDTGNFSVAHN